MNIEINPNITNLKESATLGINTQVKEMRKKDNHVYHFGFGQSPFPIHEKITQALRDHAHEKDYLPTLGLPELRQAISRYYKHLYNYDFSANNIVIGPGSKELIFQALYCLEGPVIVPAPSWVSYGPQVTLRGKEISRVATKKENNYRIQANELEASCQTFQFKQKILILNTPNNPTGAVHSDEELEAIADVCRKNNVLVISDEIYALIDFSEKRKRGIFHFYPEGTIVTAGLSKSHSAGGYRLGFMATSGQLSPVVEAMGALISETFSAVSAPIQYAAIAAYSLDKEILAYIDQCTSIHKKVANYVYDRLQKMKIESSYPQGAFYLFISLEPYKGLILKKLAVKTSSKLADYLLAHYSLALLPGSDFYLSNDQLCFRLATVDYDGARALQESGKVEESEVFSNIVAGLDKLEEFLNTLAN